MKKKRRAPIEQLREAGKAANQLLIERGIHTKESSIDKMLKDKDAPMLPGIPGYLPHQWTLKAAQQIMRDIAIMWIDSFKKNPDDPKKNDITEFWKFSMKTLSEIEKKFQKERRATPKKIKEMEKNMEEIPVLKEIFGPMRQEQNTRALAHFIADSFAVAIILKQHHSVAEYLNWFLDWTNEMHRYWTKPKK